MIYLDYAANTPVDPEVLAVFCEVTQRYPANPNSAHPMGQAAQDCLNTATQQMASLLNILPEEIIYTSGASESNNLAIKGIAHQYRQYGKHIITTYLEHSSVNGAVAALQNQGYEIDYAEIDDHGQTDLQSLKELLRDDTILVSVCAVDSEIGLRQPLDEIAQLLSGRPHCFFHVDATQAVGKIAVPLDGIDLVTFAPHKFYGINGCGVLVKKQGILLEPLIHGGVSTTPFRSGTPALGLIASTAKALSLAEEQREQRYRSVCAGNETLRRALKKYLKVRVNSNENSVPFILNMSILGAKAEIFLNEMAMQGICLSSKSACCAPNTVSRPVYALTKDRKAALSTLRVSLSHLTTEDEIAVFLDCFDACYRKFVK